MMISPGTPVRTRPQRLVRSARHRPSRRLLHVTANRDEPCVRREASGRPSVKPDRLLGPPVNTDVRLPIRRTRDATQHRSHLPRVFLRALRALRALRVLRGSPSSLRRPQHALKLPARDHRRAHRFAASDELIARHNVCSRSESQGPDRSRRSIGCGNRHSRPKIRHRQTIPVRFTDRGWPTNRRFRLNTAGDEPRPCARAAGSAIFETHLFSAAR